jgi:ribosome-binding protein aMBF1 (putative translation factor)
VSIKTVTQWVNSHGDSLHPPVRIAFLHEIHQLRESFASVVTQRRLRKGWAQEDMAAFSGLERSYISRLEKGLRTPSLDVVFRFAAAFKISPQSLVKEIKEELGRKI